VSRAFDEWALIDRDQRAFLRLGRAFAEVEYKRLWEEAGEEPYWDGGPEQLDSFEDKIEALPPVGGASGEALFGSNARRQRHDHRTQCGPLSIEGDVTRCRASVDPPAASSSSRTEMVWSHDSR
jgi:hypothetical protein